MKEKWIDLKRSKISSKIYFLLLMKPFAITELSVILFGDKRRRGEIDRTIKKLEKIGFVDDEGVGPDEFKSGNWNFYKANLGALFEFWKDIFKIKKNCLKSKIGKKSFQTIPSTLDPDFLELKGGSIINKKENFKKLNKLKSLNSNEEKILENSWEENIEIIRRNSKENILPIIRMPLVDWDVLKLLSSFWFKLLSDSYCYRRKMKVYNDIKDGKLKNKRGKGLEEIEKKEILKEFNETKGKLPELSIKICKQIRGISDNRLREIIDFLEIINRNEITMESMSDDLLGY